MNHDEGSADPAVRLPMAPYRSIRHVPCMQSVPHVPPVPSMPVMLRMPPMAPMPDVYEYRDIEDTDNDDATIMIPILLASIFMAYNITRDQLWATGQVDVYQCHPMPCPTFCANYVTYATFVTYDVYTTCITSAIDANYATYMNILDWNKIII